MSPYTNTWSGSTENINISTEVTTITALTYPDVNQPAIYSTLQSFPDISKGSFEEYSPMLNERFDK